MNESNILHWVCSNRKGECWAPGQQASCLGGCKHSGWYKDHWLAPGWELTNKVLVDGPGGGAAQADGRHLEGQALQRQAGKAGVSYDWEAADSGVRSPVPAAAVMGWLRRARS